MDGQNNTRSDEHGHPHFKTLTRFTTDYSPTNVTKYESTRTGMSVVVVNKESPKVLGYFALATEILDDSGAPHTLEHLCFMGSRSHRYKGILDKFATRAYSNTNAWTATDHTAYTLDTAGWEGFAQILPVYLEHILFPILTDSGCYTEVHHIDGTGHDAGYAASSFCANPKTNRGANRPEQNEQDTLMALEANQQLYPKGIGFRSETGGMMEQLRVLKPDRIRDFHKEMYQPRNLCLVIIGSVNEPELLDILDKFEDGIVDDVPSLDSPWKRPWVESTPVPLLKENIVRSVEFPEKDESMGSILVGYLGPSCVDYKQAAALDVIGTYLAGSSVSVLEKKMVEIADPYTTGVSWYTEERPNTVIWFELASVPYARLEEAKEKLFEVLETTVKEALDLGYLKDCLRRSKRQAKFSVEDSSDHFAQPIIADFLFANRDGSDLRQLETFGIYEELEQWSEEDWKEYIKKWVVDNPHVAIIGRPSAKLADKIKHDEKERVKAQINKYGPEGLKELADKLEAAKKDNEPEIPIEVLRGFKTPGVNSIRFIHSTSGNAGVATSKEGTLSTDIQKILEKDVPSTLPFPLYLHFEHVPSNFVTITILLSTEAIPVQHRTLLLLYFNYLFAAPITLEDGTELDYKNVVLLLEKDTIGYSVQSASDMQASESIRVRMEVEPEKYEATIRWFKLVMWNLKFDTERLAVLAKKILSDIPEAKRSGSDMAWSVAYLTGFAPESIGYGGNTLTKGKFLREYVKLIEEQPEEAVKRISVVRDTLFTLENMRVLVVADIKKLPKPVSTWESFVAGKSMNGDLLPIDSRLDRLTPVGKNPGNLMYVVPMPTLDSSFAVTVAKGPSSYDDPRIPALLLAIAYLDAVEGPLWRAIRGTGLAYGTGFSRRIDSGHLYFSVYRSPDAFKAFEMAKTIVTEYADGKIEFDEFDLDGAISTVVSTIVDIESTLTAAATTSFVLQVINHQPKDYNTRMLHKVRAITPDEIRQAMRDVLLPLFDPKTAIAVVTTAPVNTDSLKERFTELGFPVQISSLSQFSPKGDGEDDEEDMDDASEDGDEGTDEESGSEED
ncbi:hypothetical protein DRE_04453 [Drechslerella stenobrocha 248]|uniref:Peptidase M16 C-terminal domain-containing protein n=1 Tax=Drechslerella stenobrocha 248 TaxID=1043628 RepID=W7I184_9PEZI|nr:hypothetical protein DRE_04453 [Drechslerella stenobrocha 248]